MIKLEDLIEFLSEKGIEVPEGTDLDGVIKIISTLAGASDDEGDQEDKKDDEGDQEDKKESKAEIPAGVA